MIAFNLSLLFRNKILWIWPIAMVLLALSLGIWGDVEAAANSYSFNLMLDGQPFAFSTMLTYFAGFTSLIAVIGLPPHFIKNIEPERAALIFSQPVSRLEFYGADLAAAAILSLAYSFIGAGAFGVLTLIAAGTVPVQFFAAQLLFIPLTVMGYYLSITLFGTLFNSYVGSVFVGYFVVDFLSGLLLNAERLLQMIGYHSPTAVAFMDFLSYFIPSTAGINRLMNTVFSGGFGAIEGAFLLFVLTSLIPFLLLGGYLMHRKQF